ncbi:MAG: glutaredoxin domain-containing protein [Candidatus Pacebacteria bacterium]|nr:glutaredoxin domain-containing protein [Candidatus Paceibacterota bacterium]
MTTKVKVYSTPFCPYCVSLKEFLKENGVVFEEIDVSTDLVAQKEMIEKSGQMGVPVMEIGADIVIGFDKETILQLLDVTK